MSGEERTKEEVSPHVGLHLHHYYEAISSPMTAGDTHTTAGDT